MRTETLYLVVKINNFMQTSKNPGVNFSGKIPPPKNFIWFSACYVFIRFFMFQGRFWRARLGGPAGGLLFVSRRAKGREAGALQGAGGGGGRLQARPGPFGHGGTAAVCGPVAAGIFIGRLRSVGRRRASALLLCRPLFRSKEFAKYAAARPKPRLLGFRAAAFRAQFTANEKKDCFCIIVRIRAAAGLYVTNRHARAAACGAHAGSGTNCGPPPGGGCGPLRLC